MIAASLYEPGLPGELFDQSSRRNESAERSRELRRVIDTLAERLAGLLFAPVTVRVHGAPSAYRLPPQSASNAPENWPNDDLRVAFHLDGQAGEVQVGRPFNGEVISPRLAEALVELVINQTTLLDRVPNRAHIKNRFIHDLLHGRLVDEADIQRHARLLQIDLATPRAVLLIDATDFILAPGPSGEGEPDETMIQRRAQMIISSVVGFFHLPNDTICAYIGHGEVAVLKASNTRNLLAWANPDHNPDQWNSSWANLTALKRAGKALLARLRSDTSASISIGIGRYHPGIGGLALSYQDARAARSLGRRFHGKNGVHCLDELGIPAFVGVADEQTKVDLAMYLLSPLDHEPDLIETLDAFFAENCSPSATAQRLAVHRNTLAYRLDKIASLTGLDPRRFDNAVQIRLALLLRSMGADPLKACA